MHCLGLAGYEVYAPRIATARRNTALLFPGYLFVQIVSSWWNARWSAGVARLISNGAGPTPVPDQVIVELKAREHGDGLIRLPKPRGLQRGDRVRITDGPLTGHLALFDGMRPHERVMVLLELLGRAQRIELPKRDIAPAR